jgi:hypothetical protein
MHTQAHSQILGDTRVDTRVLRERRQPLVLVEQEIQQQR